MYYHIFACSTQRQLMRIPVYKKTLMNFLSLISSDVGSEYALLSPTVCSQDEPRAYH